MLNTLVLFMAHFPEQEMGASVTVVLWILPVLYDEGSVALFS